jgi:hypothetical protein
MEFLRNGKGAGRERGEGSDDGNIRAEMDSFVFRRCKLDDGIFFFLFSFSFFFRKGMELSGALHFALLFFKIFNDVRVACAMPPESL